jgi:hypothetical protein
MDNNATNINKTNTHISPQLTEHTKSPRHMKLKIQVVVWDRHYYVAGLKRLMGSHLLIIGSPTAITIRNLYIHIITRCT